MVAVQDSGNVSSVVCAKGGACTACAPCCQDYISAGVECEKCVDERCTANLGMPTPNNFVGSLRIQVTHVNEQPHRWHVSVHNPTKDPIQALLRQVMSLPGLTLAPQKVQLLPGQIVVLQ